MPIDATMETDGNGKLQISICILWGLGKNNNNSNSIHKMNSHENISAFRFPVTQNRVSKFFPNCSNGAYKKAHLTSIILSLIQVNLEQKKFLIAIFAGNYQRSRGGEREREKGKKKHPPTSKIYIDKSIDTSLPSSF